MQVSTIFTSLLAFCAGLEDSSLSNALQQGCPSYFKEDDKIYYAANGELRRAQTLQGSQRQDVTRAALEKLVRVSLLLHSDVSMDRCPAAWVSLESSPC